MAIRFLTAFYIILGLNSYLLADPVDLAFSKELRESKKKSLPLLLCVHGSSWNPANKQFLSEIWNTSLIQNALRARAQLASLHIPQNRDSSKEKVWNSESIKTYPAIQLYDIEGQLLATLQGEELPVPSTAESTVKKLTSLHSEYLIWREARSKMISPRCSKKEKIEAIYTILKLVHITDPDAFDNLKKIDPNDSSGLLAQHTFDGWKFIRHISELLKENKTKEASGKIESKLRSPHYTDKQKVFIHGAKGLLLQHAGKPSEAAIAFQMAYDLDDGQAAGIAIRNYGRRTLPK